MIKDELTALLAIIDEASALIAVGEDSALIYDELHQATDLIERMLATDAQAKART